MSEARRVLFMVSRAGSDPRAAGGDVQGSLYAGLLARAGHEITYLTSSFPGSSRGSDEDGVKVVRLGRPELLAARFWQYYRRHGDQYDLVYAEALGGARVPFCAPLYVKQPLLAAWYQLNAPVFRHQYGRWAGSLLSGIEKWIAGIHQGSTLLTPSEARRADLVDFGFRPEQVEVVPPVAVAQSAGTSVENREPLVVWLGKLRRYKCVHHAVEAMPGVLEACPEARLVIAGRRDEEGYEKELRARANSLGVAGSVRFAFDLSEDEKLALLRSARAITLPSPIEGFGIVLLEAAAQGTPAVVSDGVPEEVIREGYNGLRAPFGDVEALTAALSRMLTSDDTHAALAGGAVDNANRYSEEALTSRLREVLEHAVGRDSRELAGVRR